MSPTLLFLSINFDLIDLIEGTKERKTDAVAGDWHASSIDGSEHSINVQFKSASLKASKLAVIEAHLLYMFFTIVIDSVSGVS